MVINAYSDSIFDTESKKVANSVSQASKNKLQIQIGH